jgi:dienelactone hydrolase
MRWLILSFITLLAANPFAPHAHAQTAEEALAADLREEIRRIPVTVSDMYGRRETREIAVTIFRPPGDAPAPLAIINHGRATKEKRAKQGRQRFETQVRYFVDKGFVVLVPTRVGYSDTMGDFDPEYGGGVCSALAFEPLSIAASDQVLATSEFARTLPYVDATRWIVAGVSVGGVATVATVWRNPPGLVAAINFSGGAGGNPETSPGRPCNPDALRRLWSGKSARARVPMLWLYWENDLYWGTDNPKRWHEAWTSGGGAADLHLLPATGRDGHTGFTTNLDAWVPLVERYLEAAGFAKSGVPPLPPASSFAKADEIDKVPLSADSRERGYQKFLDSKLPRAFAIGPGGAWGWATGDWAIGRALGNCQRRQGKPCKLYAADNDVVWTQ